MVVGRRGERDFKSGSGRQTYTMRRKKHAWRAVHVVTNQVPATIVGSSRELPVR